MTEAVTLYSPPARREFIWILLPRRGISWAGVPQIQHLAIVSLLNGPRIHKRPQLYCEAVSCTFHGPS
jgi:hypothetical protein